MQQAVKKLTAAQIKNATAMLNNAYVKKIGMDFGSTCRQRRQH
eukprot:CAMPEP_0185837000 /NCGR_PEP_ID=MMETSP1353-20130828/10629_1 /TAXON_ID=1077150 /ORGANISM="Erythrolobus australicus, Strain CCMP3124" /LENGTH=42 /DNA_ID= /DNA_START= /DNA_END= /DNA_ORIENTATION=